MLSGRRAIPIRTSQICWLNLAANERGLQLLNELIAEQGIETVQRYCSYLLDNAEETVRSVIERLSDGAFSYSLLIDNGQEIKVAVSVDHEDRSATIDFTGTSATQANNFNAPAAICRAAVMYVFRTLGRHRYSTQTPDAVSPLSWYYQRGCMLRPAYPAAVVGGECRNLTMRHGRAGRRADVVLAASQGTMNNVSFGDDELQYYETIAGGAGAGADFPGESAVQTHMTNTRITDPEVLESRYPGFDQRIFYPEKFRWTRTTCWW